MDDARRLVADYVMHYNTIRLHSAIGYVAPADKLHGRDSVIFSERDRKLDEARRRRHEARASARNVLESRTSESDNGNQPVKRKRALEASNPPGIAGRVCDEWSRGGLSAAPHPHHSEAFPHASKNATSRRGRLCKARDLALQFRLNQYTQAPPDTTYAFDSSLPRLTSSNPGSPVTSTSTTSSAHIRAWAIAR